MGEHDLNIFKNNAVRLVLSASLTSLCLVIIYHLIFTTTPMAEQGEIQFKEIPSWVKHSAGWWSEDKISDKDFIKSLQWLIDNGILKT